MRKDFDRWNTNKKTLEIRVQVPFFHEREIWWCSLGVNIGVEYDGKNEYFERPVLIYHKFNKEMAWIFPMTSKPRTGPNYFEIAHDERTSWVCLSQIRTISTKRLIRKVSTTSDAQFQRLNRAFRDLIRNGPHISARSSEAEAHSGYIITKIWHFVNRLTKSKSFAARHGSARTRARRPAGSSRSRSTFRGRLASCISATRTLTTTAAISPASRPMSNWSRTRLGCSPGTLAICTTTGSGG